MSQNPDIPSFNINGVHLKRAPTNTLSQEPKTNEEEVLQEWSTPYLKSDRFDKKKNLQGCRPYVAIADYLDKHGVSCLDSDKEIQKCWPPELLEYHFDISVVRQLIEDLVEHDELPASEPRSSEAKNIDPITLWIRRLFPDYRLILFILTVMEVPKFIHYFFEDGITDACLPLRKGGLRGKSLVHNDKEICGGCPWRRSDVADFVQRYQWRANITVIDTTLNLEAPKYTLDRLSVRPWVETEQPFPNSKFSSTTAAGRTSSAKTYGGSEGHVRRVLMHPMMYKSRSPNKSVSSENFNFFFETAGLSTQLNA
jgi:hypothetical protein